MHQQLKAQPSKQLMHQFQPLINIGLPQYPQYPGQHLAHMYQQHQPQAHQLLLHQFISQFQLHGVAQLYYQFL